MVKFSKTWVEAFRGNEDANDYCIREQKGERPDDREWWNKHQEEIGSFFEMLQELHLGYFILDETKKDLVVFHTRREFKRFLLKQWRPMVIDI